MIGLLLALQASPISAPPPGVVVLYAKDYPQKDDGSKAWSDAQKRYEQIAPHTNGEAPRLKITLSVAAEGNPTACWASESSGSPDLDWATCFLALRRARFKPAQAAYNYSVVVHWRGLAKDDAPAR